MNDKQLEAARSQLSNEIAAIGYGWINGKYRNPPKKYRLREKEFDCIDMINSLLCYGYSGYSDDAAAILHSELNSYHSYLASYVDTLLYSSIGSVQFAIVYDSKTNTVIENGCSIDFAVEKHGDKDVIRIGAVENQLLITV